MNINILNHFLEPSQIKIFSNGRIYMSAVIPPILSEIYRAMSVFRKQRIRFYPDRSVSISSRIISIKDIMLLLLRSINHIQVQPIQQQ